VELIYLHIIYFDVLIKILHIIPNLNKGGAERITLDICQVLASREDVEVILLIIKPEINFEIPDIVDVFVTCSNVKLSIWKKNKYYLQDFEKLIARFQPDVIHSHLFDSEVLSRARVKKNIIYISHIHDNIIQFNPCNFFFPTKRNLVQIYERLWIFNRYKKINNHFISISIDTTFFLKSVLPKRLKNNIFELSNAINYKHFENNNYRYISKDLVRIVSVGSLVKKKNHRLILEVASKLKDLLTNIEFFILGDGPERSNLQNEIINRGLSNHVKLLGNVNDVSKYLNMSSIFLHTATYEPFGLVLLEAMASGLPVISLDGGGNRDIVLDGKNGFLIKENVCEKFVRKILFLIDNPVVYQNMSTFSKQFSKQFDIHNYVEKLVDFYKKKIKLNDYNCQL
jgi:glycosyltransferase involved in cell wall biosynthesis